SPGRRRTSRCWSRATTICAHSATEGSAINARVEYLREMRTVIVGCGRVGSNLARWLGTEGDQVTVVDFDERAFNRLGEDFPGDMIFGTAVDEDVLRKAGTEHADAFVAVTHSDTTNIMAGQLARGIVALASLGFTPLACLAAGLVDAMVGLCYAELASAYPVAGGGQYFALRGLGDIWGFVAGAALLLDYTIDIALFTLISFGY